jgi:hypothetical protein
VELGSLVEEKTQMTDLAKNFEQDYFYIAETSDPDWPQLSTEAIFEELDNHAIECWRDSVTKEEEEGLATKINAVVDEFLKKHELVTWFSIKNPERVELGK